MFQRSYNAQRSTSLGYISVLTFSRISIINEMSRCQRRNVGLKTSADHVWSQIIGILTAW